MAISNNSTGLRTGVCTSTTRPTAPYEGQQIYETDTDLVYLWNGSAWVETVSALTKAPRGIISYTLKSSGTTNITTATTTILTAPSFTLTSSRYIKITGRVEYLDNASNVTDINLFLNNGSGNVGFSSIVSNVWPEYTACIPVQFVGLLTAGTYTYRMDIALTAGTNRVNHYDSRYVNLLIEDIGAA